MSNYYICAIIQRIILPACFITTILIRPVGMTIVYMFMYFYQPFVPVPTKETFKGHSGNYFKVIMVVSWLCLLIQIVFQTTISTAGEFSTWLGDFCDAPELIFRHFGLVSLGNLPTSEAVKWVTPEVLVVLSSTLGYAICYKLCSSSPSEEVKANTQKRKYRIIVNVGKYGTLLMMMLVGVVEPCILSCPYFLFFLVGATWWASGKELGKVFAIVCRIFMIYMIIHLTILFVYVITPVKEFLPPDEQISRVLGLLNLINMNCTKDPRVFEYVGNDWSSFSQSFLILIGYYILALESSALLDTKELNASLAAQRRIVSGENTPLIRHLSPHQVSGQQNLDVSTGFVPSTSGMSTSDPRRSIASISCLYQDSTVSATVGIEEEEEVEDDESKEDLQDTIVENIIIIVMNLSQIIMRTSYIATIIAMMAWSIMYHSWLTFMFLLWANVTWMMKDQRGFTLKFSPLVVCYAEILLLAQFVYGMNLKEDELPTSLKGINLSQLGLDRPNPDDISPIILKTMFTIVFLATLRLRASESKQRKRSIRLQGLATPLQLGVSTAGSVLEEEPDLPTSPFVQKAGAIVKWFLTRFWICIVVIMLFVIGITGERMTIFRILYMALFLLFIVMFQISWRFWRRMMYGFWVTVVVYSMLMLILIYIYQFDNFPQYLEDYIKIQKTLQLDIGLELYKTKDLFLGLLTPTLFLIVTMIQLQYFHKDFLQYTNLESKTGDGSSNKDSQYVNSILSSSYGMEPTPQLTTAERLSWPEVESANAAVIPMDATAPPVDVGDAAEPSPAGPSSIRSKQRSIRRLHPSTSRAPSLLTEDPSQLTRYAFKSLLHFLNNFFDLLIHFLELHLTRFTFFSVVLLCVFDVCALHVIPMVLVTVSLYFSSRMQNVILHILSVLLSIFLLGKMIYQIDYIVHENYHVNCTEGYSLSDTNSSIKVSEYNNAEWIGFKKKGAMLTLPQMTKGYIGIIIMMTVHSMINFRQRRKRLLNNLPLVRPKVMFPNITRKEADDDIVSCLKFLFNYGFYKFGIEICLMFIVVLIGSRMDIFAVVYSVWLCYLMAADRERLARSWTILIVFLVVLIPLQYIISVGILPDLCIEYPWQNATEPLASARDWLFLPDPGNPPDPKKIICDFTLLLACSRQAIVFRIERKFGNNYKGGSNDDTIGENWESSEFINPVPDFVTYIRSWLDVVKRILFLGMLWLALAIMFLTGTNRVNLFSLGYLIGSFIFLWQGTDFYLRAREDILRWWGYLLNYNVLVITVKALLQIAGCIFISDLQENVCWLVQLLGIGCVDKFRGGTIGTFFKMTRPENEHECSVPREDIGLAWDGVCFVMLLLQRRLLQSYYFLRIIDESKASSILASRGAELIEELRQKQMKRQEDQEQRILEKIKVKMERIKANQRQVQGSTMKEPLYHDTAVRSGDYYMFDEFNDDEELGIEDDDLSSGSEEDYNKQMTVGELLSEAMRTDMRHATAQASLRRRRRDPTEGSYPSRISESESVLPEVEKKQEDLNIGIESSKSIQPSDIHLDEQKETVCAKILRYLAFGVEFVESIFISLARKIRKLSRDYRYIAKVLSKEKKLLKEDGSFGLGVRTGADRIWEPSPDKPATLKRTDENKTNVAVDSGSVVSLPISMHGSASSESETELADYDDEIFAANQTALVQFLFAVWYAILAHTDIVCYLMIFLNQIQSATLLSLPLPLMVFLWGTLCIPRPTKTFWVTIIAYTEVLVLTKSMFQYEILPWNQKVIPDNMPFNAPRIIGIERKSNYAVYDLILLLLVFFHRFMLKSLGLWTATQEKKTINDGLYPMRTEDEAMINSGQGELVGKIYAQQHMEDTMHQLDDDTSSPTVRKRKKSHSAGHYGEPDNSIMLHEIEEEMEEEDQKKYIRVSTSFRGNSYGDVPNVVLLSIRRYLRPFKIFFIKMIEPTSRVTADVYAYMFICDFFNFLVVIFGFSAFGTHQGDGGVQAYLQENKVPIPFLIMLILQFILIVIDRALYLRKYILGKIIFQLCLIVGIHTWMFFVLPAVTDRSFNSLIPPPLWYMVKCIYLLLSAYQIRCGFPTRILGNFLCKGYTAVNTVLFKGFKATPFLFELRALMDWIWTDTSMTLMDWLKMEDIFSIVFQLKCSRTFDSAHPQPRGVKKTTFSKYVVGGFVLTFIIALIWFPLVLFAFGNSVGVSNPPYDVTVKIRVGPFLPVYTMSAQSSSIYTFSEVDFDALSNIYKKDRTAQTFLSNYMFNDLAAVVLNSNSTNVWAISPPDLARLQHEAQSDSSLHVKFTYVISHKTNSKDNPPIIEEEVEIDLSPFVAGSTVVRNPEREKLIRMLNGTAGRDEWVLVHHIFPKFVKVLNKGTALPVPKLMNPITSELDSMYRNISLRLVEQDKQKWWQVSEACADANYQAFLKQIPHMNCDQLMMYTFNDKIFPETLNFISGSGIIGLYTTFVFLASRVIRTYFAGQCATIMFEDLPNVDRVLQLCLDIYLVREVGELSLEEDLFAKLVFLYRSPETMIKWSRPKDEPEPEEEMAVPRSPDQRASPAR